MILTCPDCATSYFVDDDRVPPEGRTVKCTSCGNRWRATPETEADPTLDSPPPTAAPAASPLATGGPAAEAESPPPPDDDLEFVAAPPKSKLPPSTRKAPPLRLVLAAGAAAMAVAAIGAVVLFRQPIVDAAPGAAPAFNAMGLEVDTLGLVIEDVTSQAVLQGGRPVLSITGVIRNRYKTAAQAPPIRISLLDKHGEAVAGLLAEPLNAKVPPRARRYFAVSMPDPPVGAHDLEIAFDLTAAPAAAGHGADAESAAEPDEAKPLAEGSPDALAPHDKH